jgi:hypothetical protein
VASQPFAISRTTQHSYLAQRLLDAITSDTSAQHFQRLGFQWQGGSK